jgi:hypothetical protein
MSINYRENPQSMSMLRIDADRDKDDAHHQEEGLYRNRTILYWSPEDYIWVGFAKETYVARTRVVERHCRAIWIILTRVSLDEAWYFGPNLERLHPAYQARGSYKTSHRALPAWRCIIHLKVAGSNRIACSHLITSASEKSGICIVRPARFFFSRTKQPSAVIFCVRFQLNHKKQTG